MPDAASGHPHPPAPPQATGGHPAVAAHGAQAQNAMGQALSAVNEPPAAPDNAGASSAASSGPTATSMADSTSVNTPPSSTPAAAAISRGVLIRPAPLAAVAAAQAPAIPSSGATTSGGGEVVTSAPVTVVTRVTSLMSPSDPTSMIARPLLVRIPASLADVRRGAVLEEGPDGLVRSIPVATFSAAEIAALNSTNGSDAVRDILLPASQRGQAPPNLGDIHVRMQVERETVPLLQCFGSDGFAQRVLGTLRHLHTLLYQTQRLQAQDQRSDLVAENARLTAKVNELVENSIQQEAKSQGEIQHLQREIARNAEQHDLTAKEAEIHRLASKVARLEAKVDAQVMQYDEAVARGERFRQESETNKQRVQELETQIQNSSAVSVSTLMDFIMANCRFKGYWPRLQQLLEAHWDGSQMPKDARTSIELQARDLEDDSCNPYVPSQNHASAATGMPMSSGQAARALSSLSLASSAPSSSVSSSRSGHAGKNRKASRGPKGAPSQHSESPAYARAAKPATQSTPSKALESDESAIDLTMSEPSTPNSQKSKPIAGHPSRSIVPHRHQPLAGDPMKRSPSAVSAIDASCKVPSNMSWEQTRADVRELMLGGLSFWDAVETAGKPQALHTRFGLLALVNMLRSALYWDALNSTPWMRYVPVNYFKAASERLPLKPTPEPWDPLPKCPTDDDQASFEDYDPADFGDSGEDDDDDDESYSSKASKHKSPAKSRVQQSSSGKKRTRKSASSSRGPHPKKSRRESQTKVHESKPTQFNLPPLTAADTFVELPGEDSNWRYYGIMVQHYTSQTLGFPNYTPVRKKNNEIHARWDPFEYLALLDEEPWNDMWENRVTFLVFFRHSDLSEELLRGLGWIINFMSVWRREYWERGHWVTMTIVFYFYQDPRFLALSPERQRQVLTLYDDRKARGNAFSKARDELMLKLQTLKQYGDEIWFEPGLWVIPENPCDWIWRHPEQGISLQEQLEEIDLLEPARTQWATRSSDKCFLDVAPEDLLDQVLSRGERVGNPLPKATSKATPGTAPRR